MIHSGLGYHTFQTLFYSLSTYDIHPKYVQKTSVTYSKFNDDLS